MTKARPEYERISAKAERGEYSLILPLDFLIILELPVVGTTLGGLYELGSVVSELSKKFEGQVSAGVLGGRLRTLEQQGLTAKIKTLGSGKSRWAWQATAKGVALATEWKEQHGGN